MRSRSARILSRSGAWANLTYASVPPRKSIPSGMPCHATIDMIPAMLKMSEKPRKYHFLLNQSMLGLRKNSTITAFQQIENLRFVIYDLRSYCCSSFKNRKSYFLNAECFAGLLAVEQCIKDHTRYKHRSEQVGQQTKRQRHRKSLYRPRAKHEENDGRNDGGHVGINDRDPRVSKPLVHRCCGRFACAQLLANALEDKHVRVNAHTDCQDHAGNSRQRERRSTEAEEPEQNYKIQDQRQIGIHARKAVVNQHEYQYCGHTHDRGLYAVTNGIGAQRRPHRPLL